MKHTIKIKIFVKMGERYEKREKKAKMFFSHTFLTGDFEHKESSAKYLKEECKKISCSIFVEN